MIMKIQEKNQDPYIFLLCMLIIMVYQLWSSEAMNIICYGSTHSLTELVRLHQTRILH